MVDWSDISPDTWRNLTAIVVAWLIMVGLADVGRGLDRVAKAIKERLHVNK